MWSSPRLLGGISVFVWCVVLAVDVTWAAVPAKEKPLPPFAEVRKTVLKYFEDQEGYRPGDLITQDQVKLLLSRLRKQGFPVANAEAILEKVPVKGEFLVNVLSTPDGRRFMRRIAKCPEGYDRVDRMSWLPQGEQTVRIVVAYPDGDKVIEFMTTTKGGRQMSRMISASRGGADFDAPTGRIYTVSQLLEKLQESHAAALKAAEGKNSP